MWNSISVNVNKNFDATRIDIFSRSRDGFLNPEYYISNEDIFIAVSQSGIRAHHGGLNFGIIL